MHSKVLRALCETPLYQSCFCTCSLRPPRSPPIIISTCEMPLKPFQCSFRSLGSKRYISYGHAIECDMGKRVVWICCSLHSESNPQSLEIASSWNMAAFLFFLDNLLAKYRTFSSLKSLLTDSRRLLFHACMPRQTREPIAYP